MVDSNGAALASPGSLNASGTQSADTWSASVSPGRRARRQAAVLAALLALTPLAFTAGCDERGGGQTFTVCGRVLLQSARAFPVHDVSSGPAVVHVSQLALLRFSEDCKHGVDVTATPPTAVHVDGRETADDGRTAGMVLRLQGSRVLLTITRPDGSGYEVTVINDSPVTASPST